MFTVSGKVLQVFTAPEGKTKDGQSYGGDAKLQLLGEVTLKNGEKKNDLLTLSMPQGWVEKIKAWVGKDITVPCGLYASGGVVKPYIPDNAVLPSIK